MRNEFEDDVLHCAIVTVNTSTECITTRQHTSVLDNHSMTYIQTQCHWLPVNYLIQYRVTVMAYNVLTTQEANYQYLTDVSTFHAPSRHLRSCHYYYYYYDYYYY